MTDPLCNGDAGRRRSGATREDRKFAGAGGRAAWVKDVPWVRPALAWAPGLHRLTLTSQSSTWPTGSAAPGSASTTSIAIFFAGIIWVAWT